MLSNTVLKQIILITDGHSNKGGCPILAARKARGMGIVTNGIGVLDAGQLGERGRAEIKKIVSAGGGICRFVLAEEIMYTIHTMSVQVARKEIELSINQQLSKVGGTNLSNLPLKIRNRIISYMTRMEDEMELHIGLLIDTSGSMLAKRSLLEKGLGDLINTFSLRSGIIKLTIVQFPGRSENPSIIKSQQTDNSVTFDVLRNMEYGGLTPTGPAIDMAVKALNIVCKNKNCQLVNTP